MSIPNDFEPNIQTENDNTQPVTVKYTYQDIIDSINQNLSDASEEIKQVTLGEQNWYKHASRVANHLQTVHGIGFGEYVDFIIQHNIDMLMPEDKLTLTSHFYSKIRDDSNLSETEQTMKHYLDSKMVSHRNKTLFLLADKNTWKLYKQSDEDGNQWIDAEPEDVRIFEEAGILSQQFQINSSNYAKNVGFIDMFRTGKEMVFRIKDITRMQNSTGTRLAGHTPIKGDIIKHLNGILGNVYYSTENTKIRDIKKEKKKKQEEQIIDGIMDENGIMQIGLCVSVEMILRHRTLSKMDDKTWFFNPEEAEYNKIAKYRRI